MIRTEKYHIDNSSVISRLLPYYLRGSRICRFLVGITTPIATIHKIWEEWAWERKIEASVTSQKRSLAWYLKHLFYPRLVNKNAEFIITQGLDVPENVIFCVDEKMDSMAYTAPCYCASENKINITMVLRNPHEVPEKGTVFTIIPPIIEETPNYDNTNYRHDIEKAVNRYMTVFNKYQIQI